MSAALSDANAAVKAGLDTATCTITKVTNMVAIPTKAFVAIAKLLLD